MCIRHRPTLQVHVHTAWTIVSLHFTCLTASRGVCCIMAWKLALRISDFGVCGLSNNVRCWRPRWISGLADSSSSGVWGASSIRCCLGGGVMNIPSSPSDCSRERRIPRLLSTLGVAKWLSHSISVSAVKRQHSFTFCSEWLNFTMPPVLSNELGGVEGVESSSLSFSSSNSFFFKQSLSLTKRTWSSNDAAESCDSGPPVSLWEEASPRQSLVEAIITATWTGCTHARTYTGRANKWLLAIWRTPKNQSMH